MAKLEQGILGPFRGKVGSLVGFVWRGRYVVRAYRKEINYPDTAGQRAEREWFVSMVRFAATARQALLLGLRERAAREQMTEGNAFVKMNKNAFKRNQPEKIDSIDSSIDSIKSMKSINSINSIDYPSIRLSEGSAAPVRFSAASVDERGVLRVAFEKNGGMSRAKGSDRVYLYLYNVETREGLLPRPAERRQGCLAVQLPDNWSERNIKLWGFVVDMEGRASMSTYIKTSDSIVSTDCANHNQPEKIHPTPCDEVPRVENASSNPLSATFRGRCRDGLPISFT